MTSPSLHMSFPLANFLQQLGEQQMYTFIYGSDMFSRFVLILLHLLLQNIRLHNYTFYTCKIK